jgi:hypothetical protein
MPPADVPANWDQDWDQTLDHLSAVDRHDTDPNGVKDVSLARKPGRRRSRQVRPSSR